MKNIAIFLSSTFNDMQSERDVVRERVTPEIEENLKKHGRNVEFIDLRWGIDTGSVDETAANRKILKTCFEEIKSTDPFFIAFIGERYGWIPDESDVIAAFENEGLKADADVKGKSVTELEIECARRVYPIMDKCIFYFREPVDYGGDATARELYVSQGEERKKLDALKKRIAAKYPSQVRSYTAKWNEDAKRIEGLTALERAIIADINGILANDPSLNAPPESRTQASINAIDGTASRLASSFSGRETERAAISEFVRGDERIFMLCGQSGSGKSSLLAKAVEEASAHAAVIPFFTGADEYCGTAEDLMRIGAYRAAKYLDMPVPDIEGASGAKLSGAFTSLINRLALDRKVLLVVDAVNQLARTEYEQKLKWLNPYALHRNVKILMSATTDYYQLGYARALGAKSLDLDYFSAADVRTVSERFFAVNHKQPAPRLLDAIVGKGGADNPCRLPIYLLTLLQQLNNLGGEDFASIKAREKSLGESAADAIVGYLADIVSAAPSGVGAQLDSLLNKTVEKAGEICRIFVTAIAVSRRGMSERLIDKVCAGLGEDYDGATFAYFRRLFKTNLVKRENGAWDFGHGLVKAHYAEHADAKTKKRVVDAIADCLLDEDDESTVKRGELAYALAQADRLDMFVPYFSAHSEDDEVRQSLLTELQSAQNTDKADKLFSGADPSDCILKFVAQTIADGQYAHDASEKYAFKILRAVYSTEGYASNKDKLVLIFDVYRALGSVAFGAGYYRLSRDYLRLALGVAEKAGLSQAEILGMLADCYAATGGGIKSAKYRRRAVFALESDKTADDRSRAKKLFAAYRSDCEHKISAFVRNKKDIAILLGKMSELLDGDCFEQSDKCLFAAEILRIAAYINGKENEYSREITLCEALYDGLSECEKAAVFYALGRFYGNVSVNKAREYVDKAYAYAAAALKEEVTAEALAIADKIAEEKITYAKMRGESAAELVAERVERLDIQGQLQPTYESAQKYIECERAVRRAKKTAKSKNEGAVDVAKKTRRHTARGVVTAEQKTVNKILISVFAAVVAVYVIFMPIFISFMRGVAQEWISGTPYSMFVNFYVQAVCESFFNVFFLFGLYGVMQTLRPDRDYAAKRVWFVRAVVFLALSAILLGVYAALWKYYQSIFMTAFEDGFVAFELKYLLIWLSELVLPVLVADEIVAFISRELPCSPKSDNYKRFVGGYAKSLGKYAVSIAVLVCTWVAMIFLAPWFKRGGYSHLLFFDVGMYKWFATAVAVIIAVKLAYLTVMYFVIKKKAREADNV